MFVKIAGVSAVLAGLFVVALEIPSAQGRTPVKVYPERAPSAAAPEAPVRHANAEPTTPTVTDTPKVAPRTVSSECRRQAWPYVDPACTTSAERRPVRTITIERREGVNTSNLVRLPIE